MKIKVEGKKITIRNDAGERDLYFETDIMKALPSSRGIILLLNKKDNCNMVCVNEKGEFIWVVENPDEYQNRSQYKTSSPFTAVWIDQEGRLVGGNWDGNDYFIDLTSGRIVGHEFTK